MGLRSKVVVPEDETVGQEVEEQAAYGEPADEPQDPSPDPQLQEVVVASPQPEVKVPTLLSLLNKWSTDDVGNVFPRLVGTNGALFVEKLSLGEWANVQVFSHNERWMVVPLSEILNDPKVKKFCRASYDGKTVFDRESGVGISIDEYASSIKDTFPKGVKIGKYHDIYCTVFASQKNAEEAKKKAILQVSVSPTAVKDWQAFIRTAQFRELQGTMLPSHRNCLRLVADPRSTETAQNYVAIVFQTVPLEDLAGYTPILE